MLIRCLYQVSVTSSTSDVSAHVVFRKSTTLFFLELIESALNSVMEHTGTSHGSLDVSGGGDVDRSALTGFLGLFTVVVGEEGGVGLDGDLSLLAAISAVIDLEV